MKDDPLYLIDTTILIYAYENEESSKKAIAQKLLVECFKGSKKYVISSQNLAEFACQSHYQSIEK